MAMRETTRCLNPRFLRRRTTMTILFSLIVTFFLFSKIFPYAWIDFGYLIRPIWDKDPYVWSETIVHYYSEGLTMQERCHAHGWTYTPNKPTSAEGAADSGSDAIAMPTRKGKVYDAVIFSVELDMLEIRMRELYDVVDHFVILESSRTFTGIPKDAVFQDNRERYSFAEDKIIYKLVPLRELRRGEEPWVNEGAMRDEMTKLLWSTDIKEGDYVIFSDVDEIPSRNAVELLSSCNNVPQAVHINLQSYVYSFEFPVDDGGKNTPTIQQWPKEGLYYNRRQISSILLANAGWHCSFCFRYIEDFKFKMKAYSHADRLRYKYMLDENYLQDAICKGADLFGMFPEAYSYRDLIHRLGPIPKTYNAVGLPAWAVKNSDKFKFLLPGGCKRADSL